MSFEQYEYLRLGQDMINERIDHLGEKVDVLTQGSFETQCLLQAIYDAQMGHWKRNSKVYLACLKDKPLEGEKVAAVAELASTVAVAVAVMRKKIPSESEDNKTPSYLPFNSIIKVAFNCYFLSIFSISSSIPVQMAFNHIDSTRRRPIFPSQNEHQSSFDGDAEVENKREGKNIYPITKAEVPKHLRVVQWTAYTPQLVSIGPYHRGKDHLKEMESQKLRLLQHVLERTCHQVELYYEEMSKLEEKTRGCYAQRFEDIDSPDFVEMMLLDAFFVVELLNASVNGFMECGYLERDPIFGTRGVLPCIQRDMLMLENQIPLFVLDKLYTLTCNPSDTNSVSDLTLKFFDSVIPVCQNLHHQVKNSKEPRLHLLHVVH
ncbi:hypothetical protein HHK36_020230 [Tetracentron sinense]|uniref:Uncharacterized protein n=1 Tax=Tetracentron sinense TaxID=13715 RepID=A0A834YX18_TETSI|nr:hypothetical protein HHK36_020230 [Tetracentron sinense]